MHIEYSLYFQGVLVGVLLPLIINVWYSLSYKRDAVTFVYACWVSVGLLQILSMPMLNGQGLLQVFGEIDLPPLGHSPGGDVVTRVLNLCQLSLFLQFGRSFLVTHKYFPRLHLISTAMLLIEALRLLIALLFQNQALDRGLWLLSIAVGLLSYPGFPIYTWKRYREGVRSAQFACISSCFFALSWIAVNLEMAGYSVFSMWPLMGLDPQLKTIYTLQAFAIGFAAVVTNFSIQSRARNIERKLRHTMQAQKEAAEQQNLLLESTVQERTRELGEQRQVFEVLSHQLAKYLPPQIHEALMAGQYNTQVSTRRKPITIFFSDIKDFTTTAETLQPEALTEYLNEYFSEMTQIALDHGATIDKYIGDAMMVFFGDPVSQGVRDDARACVNMALSMQARMKVLAQRWQARGFDKPFKIRIGINTGYCNVGNFGSDQRLSYTLIGREVNVAQRLESQAEPGGILLSHETYAHVQDMVDVEERETIRLKGISHNVKAYAVTGQRSQLSSDTLSLHDPRGVSIELSPRQFDSGERSQLATSLRQLASKLETSGPHEVTTPSPTNTQASHGLKLQI